jgi:hypothetical protein
MGVVGGRWQAFGISMLALVVILAIVGPVLLFCYHQSPA